jgi:serine/threonine protein kinase
MTPERLERVRALFEAVLEQDQSTREEFLRRSCQGDESLYAEVERLLTANDEATTFIDKPAGWHAGQVPVGGAECAFADGDRMAGRFRIVKYLGRGGMGDVYQAIDETLRRPVALKVLRQHIAQDQFQRQRFHQEALVLSRLNHPHISTLFDILHEREAAILVMEYLEGETLAARLKRGAIPLDDVFTYSIQIGQALDHAHRQGIVHRDLKPANVMITASGIKLLDFGVARLRSLDPEDESTVESVTVAGAIVGTPAYMSPEQLRGSLVDGRSDLFSLGLVMHEAVAGEPPFTGASAIEVAAAILNSPAPSLSQLTTVPSALQQVISRCLQKDPSLRFESAGLLTQELERIAATSRPHDLRPTTPADRKFSMQQIVTALVLSLSVAGILFLVQSFRKPRVAKTYSSLAVLPFVNESKSPDETYFADGMTDALIAELGGLRNLRIPARSSVMRYRDSHEKAPVIGRELGAEVIVEGAIMRVGSQVRVSLQLIDAAEDRTLWSAKYDRRIEDVLKLEAELASVIASQIHAELRGENLRLAQLGNLEPQKVNSYLQRRVTWPRGYAVVIGINNYRHLPAGKQLTYAERDAEELVEVLTSPNGGNFQRDDVHLILGTAATRARLRHELEEWLPSVVTAQDRALIFFAGNSYIEKGKGYLATYDFRREDLPGTAYPMKDLEQAVGSRVPAKWKILLADSSRSGAISPAEPEDFSNSVFSFTGCRDREHCFEGRDFGGGHGVFSYFVIQGIRGAADENHDGVITAGELSEFVRRSVKTATNGQQTPTVDRGSFDPEIPLGITPASLPTDK